jgi:hypothetical protein
MTSFLSSGVTPKNLAIDPRSLIYCLGSSLAFSIDVYIVLFIKFPGSSSLSILNFSGIAFYLVSIDCTALYLPVFKFI